MCKKCLYWEFFWSVFHTLRLNTDIYSLNLDNQSEYGKMWNRNIPKKDTFYAVIVILIKLFKAILICSKFVYMLVDRKIKNVKMQHNIHF